MTGMHFKPSIFIQVIHTSIFSHWIYEPTWNFKELNLMSEKCKYFYHSLISNSVRLAGATKYLKCHMPWSCLCIATIITHWTNAWRKGLFRQYTFHLNMNYLCMEMVVGGCAIKLTISNQLLTARQYFLFFILYYCLSPLLNCKRTIFI